MNNILFFALFTICMIVIFVLARHFFGKDALFVVGIGAAIGSNIYNINNFPILIGNMVFGMDSVIYTICVFCMLVMFIDFGKASLKNILYSTVGSLCLTAFLAFAANFALNGISTALVWNFLSYLFSIIGTLAAVWVMIFVFDKLKKKGFNVYLNIAIVLIFASLINSAIYFGLTFLLSGDLGSAFGLALAGSYIGKAVTLFFCLLAYFVEQVWRKKNIKKLKNQENENLNN